VNNKNMAWYRKHFEGKSRQFLLVARRPPVDKLMLLSTEFDFERRNENELPGDLERKMLTQCFVETGLPKLCVLGAGRLEMHHTSKGDAPPAVIAYSKGILETPSPHPSRLKPIIRKYLRKAGMKGYKILLGLSEAKDTFRGIVHSVEYL
jgi:hypothetical protein